MVEITTRRLEANGLSFEIDEAGEGPDVALCLHGFPESRRSWRRQLPFLAARGWRAVAPDMRGYGGSSRPAARDAYRMSHLVADAAALFDALGARRRLLIAHDWGALVAWTFAIRRVRPLDGLVIMNVPHPSVYARVIARSWAQRRRSWYVAAFQLPGLPEVALTFDHARLVASLFARGGRPNASFSAEMLEHYRANACQPGAMTAMLNYYRANFRGLIQPRRPDPIIETPTLMIWGERDAALGVELTAGYDDLVRDFTLRRFPDATHWVQQNDPEGVNAAMSDWMAAKALWAPADAPVG